VVGLVYNDRVSIQEISRKFKSFFENDELFMVFLLVLIAVTSFGLGRMSVENGGGGSLERGIQQSASAGAFAPAEADTYIGSKNGTTYHLPWCAGALKIKEENKIVFNSKKEAEDAGYSPAENCKGI